MTTPVSATTDRSGSTSGLFTLADGRRVGPIFALVSSLFLLWGFCNGMIDVMDKHFQDELHLSLAQSAWVQFAHYLGYFLMALPAGWLATRLGYKGGIIAGLLLVAVGGFWFIAASHIAQFWAFLAGVSVIAAGLTFLETVANPYTTVLGAPHLAASRINLAQSCNGIGWVLGPIAGTLFFYGKDASGASTGSQTLWIPYAAVGVVVVVLAVVFSVVTVPDVKSPDVYHVEDESSSEPVSASSSPSNVGAVYVLLVGNIAVLTVSVAMILWAILNAFGAGPGLVGLAEKIPHPGIHAVTAENALAIILGAVAGLVVVAAAVVLVGRVRRLPVHSIWSHPHFSGATLAQFFYVAAQAGIFSFFVNYMTSQTPGISRDATSWLATHFTAIGSDGMRHITDGGASTLMSVAFGCFLLGRFVGSLVLAFFSSARVLGLYALINIFVCILVMSHVGWLSVIGVFLSFFFMSIMFPTIFALGIRGLGVRAKRASAYIVMAIMGGAILPKLMGAVGDARGLSAAFIVPLACFALVSIYGFAWPRLSGSEK